MTKKTQALAIRRAVEFLLSLEIIHLKNKNKTDAANYKDEGGDGKLLIISMWPYNTIKIYYLSFPLDIANVYSRYCIHSSHHLEMRSVE